MTPSRCSNVPKSCSGSFLRLPSRPVSGPCWEPPVDVLETEDAILIIVALPGVEPDELKVLIDDGTLVVAGNRPMPGNPSRMMLQRLEIPHGRFERQLQLPPGRYEIGKRELRNGCLCTIVEETAMNSPDMTENQTTLGINAGGFGR